MANLQIASSFGMVHQKLNSNLVWVLEMEPDSELSFLILE